MVKDVATAGLECTAAEFETSAGELVLSVSVSAPSVAASPLSRAASPDSIVFAEGRLEDAAESTGHKCSAEGMAETTDDLTEPVGDMARATEDNCCTEDDETR